MTAAAACLPIDMGVEHLQPKLTYKPRFKLEPFFTGAAARVTRDNKHLMCACADEVKASLASKESMKAIALIGGEIVYVPVGRRCGNGYRHKDITRGRCRGGSQRPTARLSRQNTWILQLSRPVSISLRNLGSITSSVLPYTCRQVVLALNICCYSLHPHTYWRPLSCSTYIHHCTGPELL